MSQQTINSLLLNHSSSVVEPSPSRKSVVFTIIPPNEETLSTHSITSIAHPLSSEEEENLPEFKQIFTYNPCYCECPLHESVDWIGAFQFFWGLANSIICLFTLVVNQFLTNYYSGSTLKLTDEQRHIIQTALACHCVECILAWLLIVGTSHRIRCLLIFWIHATMLTMIVQLVLVAVYRYVATIMGVVTHPLQIYFIYIVWVLAKEMKAFPGGPPIPCVRQVTGKHTSPTKPIPLLIPTCGWGYYPAYYAAVDQEFYSYKHPYCLHENVGDGDSFTNG